MLRDLISGSSVKTINTSEFASNGWQFQITRINPSLAKAFLGSNFGNRKFRPGVVKRYSAAMRAGGWMLTTEAIVFDSEGFLMNGQPGRLPFWEFVDDEGDTVPMKTSREDWWLDCGVRK